MANVDTQNKRRSVDQIPGLEIYPVADGAISVFDRFSSSALYSGFIDTNLNVDTQNKRRSVDQIPGLEIYPVPDGVIAVYDRASASALYWGFAYFPPVAIIPESGETAPARRFTDVAGARTFEDLAPARRFTDYAPQKKAN